MNRINYPITLDALIKTAIVAKKKYGGDKYILISDDEEGNGFHECYYGISLASDIVGDETGIDYPRDLNPNDCVVLG